MKSVAIKNRSKKSYSRSHSMRQSIRRQKTNVQTVFFQGKRVKTSARLLKAVKKAS